MDNISYYLERCPVSKLEEFPVPTNPVFGERIMYNLLHQGGLGHDPYGTHSVGFNYPGRAVDFLDSLLHRSLSVADLKHQRIRTDGQDVDVPDSIGAKVLAWSWIKESVEANDSPYLPELPAQGSYAFGILNDDCLPKFSERIGNRPGAFPARTPKLRPNGEPVPLILLATPREETLNL